MNNSIIVRQNMPSLANYREEKRKFYANVWQLQQQHSARITLR